MNKNLTPNNIKNNIKWTYVRLKYYMCALEINVVQHCNLNCAGCTHYSPIAPKTFLDVSAYEKNINRLSKKLPHPWIREIRLLGGEPLLHNNLNSIIKITRKAYPKARILIVTNGVLLPKMNESFYASVKENDAIISITRYPINFDYYKCVVSLEQKHIKYKLYNDITKSNFTYDLLDPKGQYNKKQNFKKCRRNYCMQLVDDKIFICPYNAFCEILNKKFLTNKKYKFSIADKDYLKIKDIKSPLNYLSFIFKAKPFCKYCAIDKIKQVEWHKTEFKPSEWIVEVD